MSVTRRLGLGVALVAVSLVADSSLALSATPPPSDAVTTAAALSAEPTDTTTPADTLGRLVVRVSSERPAAAALARLASASGVRVEEIDPLDALSFHGPPDAVQLVERAAGVLFGVHAVERPVPVQLAETSPDPFASAQWSFDTLEIESAWSVSLGDPSVLIAVVDSGVSSVDELAGNLLDGYDFVDGDVDPSDPNGHGTAAATVIAGVLGNGVGAAGVCPSCRVLPVRVLDDQGAGWSDDVAAGIVWAADNGAQIINLSLGTPSPDSLVQAAVEYATAAGALVVAAAGNDGDPAPLYPAALPEVVSVAASASGDARYTWSNYGATSVDVAAPGCSIAVDAVRGTHWFCGTSAAAPIVSALAGLVWSVAPEASRDAVRDAVFAPAVANDYTISGRVSAAGLLDAFSSPTAPSPTVPDMDSPAPVETPALSPPTVPVRTPEVEAPVSPALVASGPTRVFDSRRTTSRVLASSTGYVVRLPFSTFAGYSPGASAMVNVTAVAASGWGFVTVYPCASGPSDTSNVNFDTGQTVANMVLATPDAQGWVCLISSTQIDLLVDLTAWVPAGAGFAPIAATRALDTRRTDRRVAAGSVTAVDLSALVPAGAVSVFVNVTVVDPTGWGFVTVFPCASPRPDTSNVNHVAGDVAAAGAVIALGADRRLCLYSYAATHLLVDVFGSFSSGVSSSVPTRVFDSRRLSGPIAARSVVRIRLDASSPATVALLSVTAVDARSDGFVTVYACDSSRPDTSNVNFVAGDTVANAVTTPLSSSGEVCIYVFADTHLLVDVTGVNTTS